MPFAFRLENDNSNSSESRFRHLLRHLHFHPSPLHYIIGGFLVLCFLTFLTVLFITLDATTNDADSSTLQFMGALLQRSFQPKTVDDPRDPATPNLNDLYQTALKSAPDDTQLSLKHQHFLRELTRQIWNITITFILKNPPTSTKSFLQTQVLINALPTLDLMNLKPEFNSAYSWFKNSCNFTQFWFQIPEPETAPEYLESLLSCYQLTKNQTFLDQSKELLKDITIQNISTDLLVRIPSLYEPILEQFSSRSIDDLLMDFKAHCYKPKSAESLSVFGYIRILTQLHLRSKLPDNLVTKTRTLLDLMINTKLWTNQNLNFHFNSSCGNDAKFEAQQRDCDLGAVLGLIWSLDLPGKRENKILEVAKGITTGCALVSEKNGLTPKAFEMSTSGRWKSIGSSSFSSELLESYYILYRLTGDPSYRTSAFQIARTIYRLSLDFGTNHFGERILEELKDMEEGSSSPLEALKKARFFSKTLKYLYLIFEDRKKDEDTEEKWTENTKDTFLGRGLKPLDGSEMFNGL